MKRLLQLCLSVSSVKAQRHQLRGLYKELLKATLLFWNMQKQLEMLGFWSVWRGTNKKEDLGTTKSVKMICTTSLSRSRRSQLKHQRQRKSQQSCSEDARALSSVHQLCTVLQEHSRFSFCTRMYAFFAINLYISTNIIQQRLERDIECLQIQPDMIHWTPRAKFLDNTQNKSQLICLLSSTFQKLHITVEQSDNDADTLIVREAMAAATDGSVEVSNIQF